MSRIVFFASDKPREQALGRAFLEGARAHGWKGEQRALCAEPDVSGADAIAMVGVKSRKLFAAVEAAGAVPIMLDKGYVRSRRADARVWEYWRVSVGAHHPTHTTLMRRKMPADRLTNLELEPAAWRARGYSVVLAGSSAKYHDFYGLPDPTTWAREQIEQLRKLTDLPIIYRPKPSWKDARPIRGSEFSTGNENINAVLNGAWALVTHGSNACFEAALMGVPSVVLGDGIAAPISSTDLEDVRDPKKGKRDQWLANLAYHQWTEAEFQSGQAFQYIGEWVGEHRSK